MSEAEKAAPPDVDRTEGFLTIGYSCKACGYLGMVRARNAIQAAIFGAGFVWECEQCKHKMGIELQNTIAFPVPMQPQQSQAPLNRHGRRIIQSLSR